MSLILYHDNHLLVACKPAGMATQPDFEAACRQWLKVHKGKPGEAFLHAVHRLDTPVSGGVILACTSKALSRLHASIREGNLHKEYIALVSGTLSVQEGMLEHYLWHDMQRQRAVVVDKSTPHARYAKLSYRVIGYEAGVSCLRIELHTGRYHQIRAQLSALGCPILGDAKYGSKTPFHPGAIALHHASLRVPHPTLGTPCLVQAPLPDYWPNNRIYKDSQP